jgi:hypothetical protein
MIVITLVLVTLGAISYFRARPNAVAHTAGQVSAAPASAKGPVGLQVVMGTPEPTTDGSAATSEAAAGVEGPAGLDGTEGVAGVDGVDGAAGLDGADGADGADGEAGPQGSVGATGPAGSVGATGPAGLGFTVVDTDGGGFEFRSPDGVSYRIRISNNGIKFVGPTTTEVWSDTSHFQTLVP